MFMFIRRRMHLLFEIKHHITPHHGDDNIVQHVASNHIKAFCHIIQHQIISQHSTTQSSFHTIPTCSISYGTNVRSCTCSMYMYLSIHEPQTFAPKKSPPSSNKHKMQQVLLLGVLGHDVFHFPWSNGSHCRELGSSSVSASHPSLHLPSLLSFSFPSSPFLSLPPSLFLPSSFSVFLS